MKKTLLIVSAGIEAIPGIKLAKEMGLKVIASDKDPNAPGFQFADERILASTYDIEETLKAVQKYRQEIGPIHGVMCIASDVPLTVATVAKRLGLSGISLESARLAADKLAMKQKFAQDRIPIPWFSPVSSMEHLRRIVSEHGYPLVLKPVDSRGSRGVLLLNEKIDLEWAYRFSLRHCPTGRIMIERFLSGPQVSTESILLDGVAYTPGFLDRNYEYLEKYAPYIIENGGDLPSCLSENIQKSVCDLVQKAALSLGIERGVVKGDIVIHEGKPYVIELAARLSGGYFCTDLIPLNTGVNFVAAAMRLALAETPSEEDIIPKYQREVAQRYFFPGPGRVVRIDGVEKVIDLDWIKLLDIRLKIGDIVEAVTDHTRRAGVLIAVGETRDQAIERARQAVEMIRIETVKL